MFEIKKVDVSIIRELEKLQTKMQTARDGKDPNCKLCDEDGNIQVSRDMLYNNDILSRIFEGSQSLINVKCECYSNEKEKLHQEIEKLLILQKQFRKVFGLSEFNNSQEIEGLTLSSCAKIFLLDSRISGIKNALVTQCYIVYFLVKFNLISFYIW